MGDSLQLVSRKIRQMTGTMISRHLATAALCAALGTPVLAQGAPELAYGLNLTTDYIFRGETQTDNNPAVQGYVEADWSLFYLGAWASNVRIDDDRIELDLYAGVRRELGPVSLDLNYTRYLYDESGDCCGELGILLGAPIGESVEAEGGVYLDLAEDTQWGQIGATLALPAEFGLGGTVGTDFGSLNLPDGTKYAWDIGLARPIVGAATGDLRWHDSNYDAGRLVLSIAFDF
jgi:uncharacterized protein (TIGR02001 family)